MCKIAVTLVLIVAASGCDGGEQGAPEPGPPPQPGPAPPDPPPPRPSGVGACETGEEAARRRITYVRDDTIWTSRLDGRDARRVTRRAPLAGYPAFQPGGRRIAFIADPGSRGDPDLFTISSSGRGEQVLERDLGAAPSEPAWSPDGRRIAFTDSGFLVTADADGGRRKRVVPRMAAQLPAWSPDGKWILFDGGGRAVPGSGNVTAGGLWMVRADGTQPRHLTETPGIFESDPAWSPDGRMIAYYHQGLDYGIWVTRSDGRGRRRLTHGDDSEPTRGSDCRTIAFMRVEGDAYSLRTVSLDGRQRVVRRGLRKWGLGDWSRPTLAERGPPPPIELPPEEEPRPLVADRRGDLRSNAGAVCRELAAALRGIEQPRNIEDLRRYTTRAGVPLAKAAAELRELQAGRVSTFDELMNFWYLQVSALEQIAYALSHGDHPGGGLMSADANTHNPPPPAAFVLSDCRDTVLPRLVPGVKRFP